MLWIYNIEKDKRQLSFLRKFQEKFLKKGGVQPPFYFDFLADCFIASRTAGVITSWPGGDAFTAVFMRSLA